MISTHIVNWHPMDRSDPVIWIDIAKAESAWREDDFYVDVEAKTSGEVLKYKNFGEWIKCGISIEMPHVSYEDGKLSFSNGRHRFAWLRDHGATSLPVTTYPSCEAELRQNLGSDDHVTRYSRSGDSPSQTLRP